MMNNVELALIKNYVDTAVDNVSLTSGGSSITDEEVVEIIEENLSDSNSLLATAINGKENTSNKVTSLSSSSTDTQYPSAKLLYDSLDLKADLNSPALTGVPTAPTAVYGTNTTQIATTAFVQQAVKPNVIVTISGIPVNTTVTVTVSLEGAEPAYTVTETLNSSGVAVLNLDYLGTYDITYNQGSVKGDSSITLTIPKAYSLGGYWSEAVTYTLLIDQTNSNAETACTYSGSTAGMVKGSSNWDSQPIFKDIKPCVFYNGQVNYYLNPNDWTQKADGTASDLTGADGDVMIQFPKFAYKIATNNNNVTTVSISTDEDVIENDGGYSYDAFTRITEGDLNYFYIGAFDGYVDSNNKIRSIAGVLPANQIGIYTSRTYAHNVGSHYQQFTFQQAKAIQCLFLIKYGTRNSQTAVGRGVTNNTYTGPFVTGYNCNTVEGITSQNSTLTLGMTFGNPSSYDYHMRLFGIEDLWGNMSCWMEGLTTNADKQYVISSNSFLGEDGLTSTSTTLTNISPGGGYTTEVVGNNVGGFLSKSSEKTASSSIYFCDKGGAVANRWACYGGYYAQSLYAGIFCYDISSGSNNRANNIGCRLTYI